MHPFTLLAYETCRANADRYSHLKEWYDELCYAEAGSPETPSDFEDIRFLRNQFDRDTFLLMKEYYESIKEETNKQKKKC